MSGAEVVGVVLGAVPLIVAALEHYKTSKRLWDRMRKTALHINELIEALDENHALIETSLESLLQKAVGTEGACMANENVDYASRLRRKDIAPDLQSFMGRLYKPCEKALLRCEQTLLRIVNKIDGLILGSKTPPKSLKEAIDAQPYSNGQYTFVNRIKFSVKKDELDELIAALKESRQSLEDIARARSTKDLPLPTSSPKTSGLAKFFDQIQGHASDLYSAISTAWVDKCHVNHTTRFLLKSWPEAISARRKKPRIAFKVAFAYGSQPGELQSCKEIRVEILDEDDVEEQATNQARNVRFQDVEQKPTFLAINGICCSLLPTAQFKLPLSFYLSPDRLLRYQSTGAAKTSIASTQEDHHGYLSQSDSVTLDEILTNNIRLDLRNRLTIAHVLVSAQLQLQCTPWLPTFWSKNVLRFPCIKDPNTSEVSVIYGSPFLQRQFPASPAVKEQNLWTAKRPLLELGIILLEVWNRQAFAEYASSVGKSVDESYGLRYEAAKQWLDDSEQQLLPSYSSVLSRCIECNIANTSLKYEWRDEMLRQSMCEDLLRPLHELCHPTSG